MYEELERASVVIAVIDEPDACVVKVLKDRYSGHDVPRTIGPRAAEELLLVNIRARLKENRDAIKAARAVEDDRPTTPGEPGKG